MTTRSWHWFSTTTKAVTLNPIEPPHFRLGSGSSSGLQRPKLLLAWLPLVTRPRAGSPGVPSPEDFFSLRRRQDFPKFRRVSESSYQARRSDTRLERAPLASPGPATRSPAPSPAARSPAPKPRLATDQRVGPFLASGNACDPAQGHHVGFQK